MWWGGCDVFGGFLGAPDDVVGGAVGGGDADALGGVAEVDIADDPVVLDIRRARGAVEKGTIQLRVRTSVVLVRLDYSGPRHKNPDSNWVSGTHLHVYREGFADRWADPPLREHFRDTNSVATMLTDFLTYCRIQIAPSTETMGARC